MISIIVAASQNGVIGKDNQLLWKIPEDMKFFKEKTMNKTCIMGRKTYESIGRVLPGREFIIITRQKDYVAPGCKIVHSLEEAIKLTDSSLMTMVIGGGEIYRQALKYADWVYLTRIYQDYEGDSFFPELSGEWIPVSFSEKKCTPEGIEYQFHTYRVDRTKLS